jgi:hypothetical protein
MKHIDFAARGKGSLCHAVVSSSNIAMSCMILALTAQSCLAKDAPLLSLSMEHFRDTATVKDDPIAGVTKVDTEKGFVEHHGLLGSVWNDEYLSGTIDRKSGHRSFDVVALITYRGTRHDYGSAKFQGMKGPVVVPAVLLKSNSVNCPQGECTYTDRISFSVEEGLLRALAARPAADKPELWHYSVVAKQGSDYSGEFSSAEIAGLLAKVDEYTGAAPPSVVHPAATAKPELGIGGLRVEAGAQLPARSGVLVTAVNPGSVADKAGIIVGDIVGDIDGHPIKTPPDMQAAIAAAAANSVVSIKLYRGTTQMTLSGQL